MIYKFEINKRLLGYNEYNNLNRKNRYAGNTAKKQEEEYIYYCIKQQLKDVEIKNPIFIKFTWVEENGKRDLDNICFAKKFILDAMQKANLIENDNHAHVKGFIDCFEYAEKSKVIIELEEDER